MKDAIYLLYHLLSALAKVIRPGGSRTVIAEDLLLKQQLIIHSRSRQRAPNLTTRDRTVLGFLSLLLNPRRLVRSAVIIKPSTLLHFHNALKKRKYRLLYTPRGSRKPGPKGASREVIKAIVEMKQRNSRFGCPRIAQQINLAFGLDLDKDIIRRVLAIHYKPDPSNRGPSWLTTIGHAKDSLWSVDLFRRESILLKSHWIMVVMDQYTRRIIGFAVHAGNVDGPDLCRMFNHATKGQAWPAHISSDNDPLFQYHRWKANLRVLEIEEIKSIPHVPMSHPFVERLIGSIRRELLDQTFFWTATDLENKLRNYQAYYNERRTHSGQNGDTPVESTGSNIVDITQYQWKNHCRGLFQLPVAA
ncbi:helix-turn-helix domain-containing protein [Seongchinamella sediminis]|uniref:Helix-turn-helix domain-containing protein n=2 Tax=Seongchinamella sediminis TaxID=2283635 RepID=A0A3L7DT42_9GAMM|nr:helix-turn-helix domain-containing protein [Seongchinamella sediminis]